MNARILALGAMLVLTASAVEAQAPRKGQGKGLGRGRPTADSTVRKSGDQDRDVRKGSDEDGHGRGGRMGRGPMGRNGGYLMAGINLTDAQKSQIKQIHESYRSRLDAVRDSAKVAHHDKAQTAADTLYRAHAKTLMTSERAEIRAVLTADQQVKFDANAKRMEDRMEKRGGHGHGGERSGGAKP